MGINVHASSGSPEIRCQDTVRSPKDVLEATPIR